VNNYLSLQLWFDRNEKCSLDELIEFFQNAKKLGFSTTFTDWNIDNDQICFCFEKIKQEGEQL